MKFISSSIFLGLFLTSSVVVSSTQNVCDELVMKYQELNRDQVLVQTIVLESASGGSLNYFGADESIDPGNEQFKKLKEFLEASRPTLVFYEGNDVNILNDDHATIQKYGAAGYARFLAKKSSLKMKSMEPDRETLIKYLEEIYIREKIEMTFLLEEISILKGQGKHSKEELTRELANHIKKYNKKNSGNLIRTVADFETEAIQIWGIEFKWWEVSRKWFDPELTSLQTGGLFTNEVKKLTMHYRNIYIYKLLADEVKKGEKVFAIAGKEYIPLQIPAIKCAIDQY